MQWGVGGGCQLSRKKELRRCTVQHYLALRVSGWGSNFQEKKRYITIEWPLMGGVLWCRYCVRVYVADCCDVSLSLGVNNIIIIIYERTTQLFIKCIIFIIDLA